MYSRFLAAGASFRSLAFSFRLGVKTVQRIVKKTCQVLWRVLQPYEMPVPDKHTWERSALGFYEKCQYPNCLGAIDGKHVELKSPDNSGSLYWNYKGYPSIVLMAVTDAFCRYICVEVGAYGSSSDGGVFQHTQLYKLIQEEKLDIPNETRVSNTEISLPYVFVGDEAFPLEHHLMRPFPKRALTNEKRIYNYRLSRARRQVECTFGITSSMWRILLKPIEVQPNFACDIVKAVCVLHNFILNNEQHRLLSPERTEERDKRTTTLTMPDVRCNRRPTDGAMEVRNRFMNYFVSPLGAVPWQKDSCLL